MNVHDRTNPKKGKPIVPPSSQITEPFNPSPPQTPSEDELNEIHKEMTSFERTTLRWAKLAVFISIAAAFFVCLQWCEMRSGSKDTHGLAVAARTQSDTMKEQMKIMEKQTIAAFQQLSTAKNNIRIARISVKQSEKSLDATIDNFRLDQRAWVGVSKFTISTFYKDGNTDIFIKEGHPFEWRANITNNGKTPARILVNKMYLAHLPKGEKPKLQESAIMSTQATPNTLFPGSKISLGFDSDPRTAYSKEQIESIKRGQHVLYVFGMITYEDVFGRFHWTEFCNELSPDLTAFLACPFYNETDDTQKNK